MGITTSRLKPDVSACLINLWAIIITQLRFILITKVIFQANIDRYCLDVFCLSLTNYLDN